MTARTAITTRATLDAVTPEHPAPSAVVWINGRQAMVGTMSHDGQISTCEISRGWLAEGPYVRQVVRVIGDRQRVVILGPSSVRLALEREYVAAFGRPGRLVDVEPAELVTMQELIDRLHCLIA